MKCEEEQNLKRRKKDAKLLREIKETH